MNPIPKNPRIKNLLNKRFTKLLVIEFSHIDKHRQVYWKCKCDCGEEKVIPSRSLTRKHSKSCGCLQWKGCGDLSGNTMYCIRRNAKTRGFSVGVDVQYLWDLFLKQNKKCALSGIPLTFNRASGWSDGNASLDRIDSSKGYIEGNVQWVHKHINQMKRDFTEKYFVELCKKVINKDGEPQDQSSS